MYFFRLGFLCLLHVYLYSRLLYNSLRLLLISYLNLEYKEKTTTRHFAVLVDNDFTLNQITVTLLNMEFTSGHIGHTKMPLFELSM
jgi:hypothetical protein